jgi:ribosome-associated protein
VQSEAIRLADLGDGSGDDDGLEPVMAAARAADAKSGVRTVVLDVGDLLGITGHFVITSGGNTRLVRTLAEEIERAVAECCGRRPVRVEGLDALRWVLLDYGDFVVHVFLDDERDFYDLERLWSDVPRVVWQPDRSATG